MPIARRRLLALVAAGTLVVAGGITYLTQSQSPSGGLPALAYEPGVIHVHGLGIDPADGVLYAATHSGLFRIPETGEPTRVANREQDTMGFSVVGPGTFLGSGHPDPREDDVRPPLLGLIESTDAGRTWTRLSLHGKADFHTLHAAHGQVYGYDSTSGTLMVTKDRTQWDRRSQLPMRDFAVSPASPETLLATTERGVVRSTDGGRTWQPTSSDGPRLVVLTWRAEASVYGVATDGAVFHSTDGGATWTVRGTVAGGPEALAVDTRDGTEVLFVAVNGRGILASTDGGRSFTTRYRGPATH